MKKLLVLLLALLMAFSLPVSAEEALHAYVSITDDTGALVLAYESVAVTDADADGVVTIGDALACAHAAFHEAGSEAFGLAKTEFGLSMTKLWGVENGGSYGYSLNDASSWSLLDPVAEGDHVKAYAYTDLMAWSDTYSYFAAPAAEVKVGEAVELVLKASGFDVNFAPVTLDVEDAVITVNGEDSGVKTDAEGKASLTFDAAGTYVVSATSESMTLVAPVCIVTVNE